MHLTSLSMTAVERSLDGLAARQAAIAHNIANIATPGYVKREVPFEETLLQALDEAHRPISSSGGFTPEDGAPVTSLHNDPLISWRPVTTTSSEGPQRLDGNQVAVEKEISAMASNAIKFNALSAVIAKDFQLLRTIAQAR
ncbi:MAG: flagellar basal body rod protein FlgB [Candidatus Sericytochromatia bacterium]|nr:flagellar basal body rod protein FlgB [Candidatus Sericytochromatia bacterium]